MGRLHEIIREVEASAKWVKFKNAHGTYTYLRFGRTIRVFEVGACADLAVDVCRSDGTILQSTRFVNPHINPVVAYIVALADGCM